MNLTGWEDREARPEAASKGCGHLPASHEHKSVSQTQKYPSIQGMGTSTGHQDLQLNSSFPTWGHAIQRSARFTSCIARPPAYSMRSILQPHVHNEGAGLYNLPDHQAHFASTAGTSRLASSAPYNPCSDPSVPAHREASSGPRKCNWLLPRAC